MSSGTSAGIAQESSSWLSEVYAVPECADLPEFVSTSVLVMLQTKVSLNIPISPTSSMT